MNGLGAKVSLITGNPMTKVLVAILAFEAIVVGLAVAVMVQVSDVSPVLAGISAGVVALLAIIGAGTLRRGAPGYLVGWLTQIALVATGFLTPAMWVMAVVFGGLWLTCFILGKRLESEAIMSSDESGDEDG
ncbi:DUF4233 domain-containing protein [Enemella sp. A6]|uniref:DUF4233 domain-containing protein n=1 Tax=Enemella sp. A6 TaxID=3440152 RepID=UPI003EBB0534